MKWNDLRRHFKKVALIIFLLAIVFGLAYKAFHLAISQNFFNWFGKTLIISAALFFIVSKEKVEDRTVQINRYLAVAIAFLADIGKYFFGQQYKDPFLCFFSMMLTYIVFFSLLKSVRIEKKHTT